MTTLLLLLAMHGLFLGVLLAVVGARRDPANYALAGLVSACALLALWLWLNRLPATPGRDLAILALFPAWYLIGPLSLRYTQQFLRQPKVLPLSWVGLGPLLAGVWALLWEIQPPAVQADASARIVNQTILYGAFWMLTALCALRCWQALEQAGQSESPNPRPDWHQAWLRTLIALLLIYSALDLVMTLSFMLWSSYPSMLGVVSVMVLTGLIYSIGLVALMPEGVMSRVPWPGQRYRRSWLEPEQTKLHVAQLERLMETERLWQNDQLSLASLAEAMTLTSHQLSQLFNQHLQCTFNDYVNRHRVAHAKRLLAEQGQARSVLDIGFECGFGSSATFYRVFRKETGMSPRAFGTSQSLIAASHDSQPARRKAAEPTAQSWPIRD